MHDSLNLESILNKHSKQKEEDILLLDVDEYLNKLKNYQSIAQKEKETSGNNEDERSHFTTENSTHLNDRTDSENDASSELNYEKKGSSNTERNKLQTPSSKTTNIGARVPKNMKEFMKSQLSKTKQTGQNAVMMICNV